MNGNETTPGLNIPTNDALIDIFQINKTSGFSHDINTFYFQTAQNFIDNKNPTESETVDWSMKLNIPYKEYIRKKMEEKMKLRRNRVTGKEIRGVLSDYNGKQEEILEQVTSFVVIERGVESFDEDMMVLSGICREGDISRIKDKILEMQKKYLGIDVSSVVGDIIG